MYAGSFDVRVHLRGPVVSHSSAVGGFGVDTVMAKTRDADGGERYYLAGTLVKGLVGEAWQELGRQDWRDRYMGRISGSKNEPDRGRMFFTDFLDLSTLTSGLRAIYRI